MILETKRYMKEMAVVQTLLAMMQVRPFIPFHYYYYITIHIILVDIYIPAMTFTPQPRCIPPTSLLQELLLVTTGGRLDEGPSSHDMHRELETCLAKDSAACAPLRDVLSATFTLLARFVEGSPTNQSAVEPHAKFMYV